MPDETPSPSQDILRYLTSGQYDDLVNLEKFNRLPEGVRESLMLRPLSDVDFYYLLSRYPYLNLCESSKFFDVAGRKPTLIEASSGWTIYDYGYALAACVGRLGFGSYGAEDEDDGGGGGVSVEGKGTLVNQYTQTAFDMVALAMERAWDGIHVVSGFYGMVRAAWMASKAQDYSLSGFNPSMSDEVIYDLVDKVIGDKLRAVPTKAEALRPKR